MNNKTASIGLAIASSAMLLNTPPAASDPDLLQLAAGQGSAYVETYLKDPQVSGNLLVGVQWTSAEKTGSTFRFDPANVRLPVSAKLDARSACVNITSRDGRYSAENLYAIPGNVGHDPRLAIATKYKDKLEAYPARSIAIMIRTVSSCDAAEFGTIIPARPIPHDTNGPVQSGLPTLTAYVNADPDRVSLHVLDKDKGNDVADALCTDAGGGVEISFSTMCMLQPRTGLSSGIYRLRLAVKERFKTVTRDFLVQITE